VSTAGLLAVILPTVVAASFLSGIFGLAGGFILMGVLLLIMPVVPAMILHGAVQSVSNGWRAVVWWRYIRFRIFPPYALGTLVVAAAWSAIRFVPDKSLCYLIMGLIPAISVMMPVGRVPTITNPFAAFGAGAIMTALQLTSGAAGPVIDAMFVASGFDRREIVASKAFAVCWSHGVKLVYFGAIWDLAAPDTAGLPLWFYGLAIAMAVIGTTLARGVLERMDNERFLLWSRWLIIAVSAVYIARGIAGYAGIGGIGL